MYTNSLLFGALALISSTTAQTVQECPGSGVCYSVNIPEATASSGSGDMFFQITGPTSMSWIGFGQGGSMSGSNIFIIYSNAAGNNITLSNRLGVGNREPAQGATSQLTLLDGTGIANNVMTANVKCSNCQNWSGGSMSLTDTQSKWIWAYRTGSPINSDSASAPVTKHNQDGDLTINLQQAAGGSSVNPFAATGGSSGGSSGGTTPAGTPCTKKNGQPGLMDNVIQAHALMGVIAFVLLFPIGSMIIRLLHFRLTLWMHAGWMLLAYALAIACMGTGIWYARLEGYMGSSHAILGIFVVCALILQPFSGIFHHLMYKKTGTSSFATPVHVWWGRIIVSLGIINGGLGLDLGGQRSAYKIGYAIVAAVFWLLWMGSALFAWWRKGRRQEASVHGSKEMQRATDSEDNLRTEGRQQDQAMQQKYT
ncbi:hypothetical protein HYFRA_00005155 [Hymenoscyphus fraxineus]|uniref:Cytochrome b561 domain-containing protein n=1 Tax=Hymenoscyphus fraxineus TaxID=746836 RepID=A0A9N9LET8_9HELO|nr:hypothetical protein HYFRA_00005155 [Hymenoscyphus fraxineus]